MLETKVNFGKNAVFKARTQLFTKASFSNSPVDFIAIFIPLLRLSQPFLTNFQPRVKNAADGINKIKQASTIANVFDNPSPQPNENANPYSTSIRLKVRGSLDALLSILNNKIKLTNDNPAKNSAIKHFLIRSGNTTHTDLFKLFIFYTFKASKMPFTK